MPNLKIYDLFLSHAWDYNSDYYRLIVLLDSAPLFRWRNYSVPKHDPLINPNTRVGRTKLSGMLANQLKPVNCVLILGGMYSVYSNWIIEEIEIANYYNKPIVGKYPWGQQRMPIVIQESASELVGWNTNSIVSAVRRNSI